MKKYTTIILVTLIFLWPVVSLGAVVNRSGLDTSRINKTLTEPRDTGLLSHWTFDGPDMLQRVVDRSGQGNSGFIRNITATSTAVVPGKIGQGLKFDGSDDAVVASTDFISTSAATVCAWINPQGWGESGFGRIIDNGSLIFFLNESTGNAESLRFSSDGGTTAVNSATNSITLGRWQLACVTRNASGTANFYVDGTLSGTANQSSGTPAEGSFSVTAGNNSAGTRTFNGSIDDIKIYNRVLSAAEITSLYNQTNQAFTLSSGKIKTQASSLSGWWTFNGPELSATAVTDKSGNGNAGTLNSFPTIPLVIAGKSGQALLFDGVDDNVSLGDTNESGTITLTAWVKPTIVKTGMKILSKKMSGASAQYGIATSGSSADKFTSVFFSSAPSSDVCESTGTDGTYTANQWYFVSATYDGNTCKMYVNGVDATSVTSDVAAGDILNTTSTLRIGSDGGSSPASTSYFSGAIDEVRIYSRVLTATEIQKLYSMGR